MLAPRKRVGVLTFHKCINYGSYWQARCLVEGLRARGHDAELLDHDCACVQRAELRCALQPKLPERTPAKELGAYAGKTRKFIDAIAALPLSRRFSLHDARGADAYDTIVVGSDEVWNFRHPWYGSKPIFFGDGLKTERLVAYAASFGNHSAWDGIHPFWARKLDRFSAVSVRDCNSWHLVSGATGRDAELVLDPCLLFPEIARKVGADGGAPYALVYGHGFPDWFERMTRTWADDRGIRLVSVGYANAWADEQRVSAGPDEFVRLMCGTRAVVTNFFHGCVFALANGKPWATVPSDYRSIKIPDLAAVLGAEQRIVDEQTSEKRLAELLDTPVTAQEAERVKDYRARSEAFLDEALC
jgi:hypothetical protein